MAIIRTIEGMVTGDSAEIRRPVSSLPYPMDLAWMTVKRNPLDSEARAIFQKTITTTLDLTQGFIENDGSGDNEGLLRFFLQPAETARLIGTEEFYYDIQIRVASEPPQINTFEWGKLYPQMEITRTTDGPPGP